MRTISLVKRLKWSFSGNMNPHALVIGDVDNDKENEFVIGNLNGDLAIFKGQCEDGYPSYVCRGLGTITCIAIGDVRNNGKNSVVIINAEGHAHIFDIPPISKTNGNQHQQISVDDYLRGGRRASDTASIQTFRRVMSMNGSTTSNEPPPQQQQQQQQQPSSKSVPRIHDLGKPNLTLKVPVNVNKILIADIDNDSLNELILARTDRILHAFQLVPSDINTPFDHMYKGIQTPSLSSLSPSASTASLVGLSHKQQASQKHNEEQTAEHADPPKKPLKNNLSSTITTSATSLVNTEATNSNKKISLLDKNMWVFDGQISSLCTTTHPDRPNEPLLLVAQPGNTFTIIDQDGKRYNSDFTPQHAINVKHAVASNTVKGEDENRIRSLLNSQTLGNYNLEIYKDSSALKNDDTIELHRSNYVVKNWPVMDAGAGNNNDDVIDDEIESGAVATEIVIGKRHLLGDSYSSSEVGMLSMDGKFSIYDLKTKTTSQRDLFVTHKLFSLATLDVSSSSKSTVDDQTSVRQGTQTPKSNTSHLRFNTESLNGSLSRTSSKLSLNNEVSRTNSKKEEEEEVVINKQASSSSSDSDSELSTEDEDDSDYESVPWSEGSEEEDEPGCDLFVACAWNGVTYLIDWSKKLETDDSTDDEEEGDSASKIKYQLVKFAFEGRVCAFTAGLYTVENHVNVPCLFYVDFEDQIYVYYDVRITPGPVNGFIDTIDDDIDEALDRIIGIESGINSLVDTLHNDTKQHMNIQVDPPLEHDLKIDLGDGWQGIAEEDEEEDEIAAHFADPHEPEDSDPLNLADFIHECLYGFHDMKDRMENDMLKFEQRQLSNRLPPGSDARRLSDLNITIEPPSIDNDITSDTASILLNKAIEEDEDDDDEDEDRQHRLYPTNTNISERSSEAYDNDTHISSWIEGSLIGSSLYDKDDEED